MRSFMDWYFEKKRWVQVIIDLEEWILLWGIGFLFPNPHIPHFLEIKIGGIILIGLGLYLHHLSHKTHKEAHKDRDEITKVVTNGIYAKIRHPGYAAYIIAYIGSFLVVGSLSMLIPIIIFTIIIIDTVRKEEETLLAKFPAEYAAYKNRVRWRFFPGLF